MRQLRNILLFFLAPFIALAYIVALPAVGFFYFIRFAIEAIDRSVKDRALFNAVDA